MSERKLWCKEEWVKLRATGKKSVFYIPVNGIESITVFDDGEVWIYPPKGPYLPVWETIDEVEAEINRALKVQQDFYVDSQMKLMQLLGKAKQAARAKQDVDNILLMNDFAIKDEN